MEKQRKFITEANKKELRKIGNQNGNLNPFVVSELYYAALEYTLYVTGFNYESNELICVNMFGNLVSYTIDELEEISNGGDCRIERFDCSKGTRLSDFGITVGEEDEFEVDDNAGEQIDSSAIMKHIANILFGDESHEIKTESIDNNDSDDGNSHNELFKDVADKLFNQ